MSGFMTNFEIKLKALRYIADSYPCWVSRKELSGILNGTIRTHQRTLQELVKLGYLECDRSNPVGYRLIKGKFKEFQGL